MRHFFLALGLAFVLATSAQAQMSMPASTFLDMPQSSQKILMSMYLKGLADGMAWYRADLHHRDPAVASLYCLSSNIALTEDEYVDMLRQYVAKQPEAGSLPLGIALLGALENALPCGR